MTTPLPLLDTLRARAQVRGLTAGQLAKRTGLALSTCQKFLSEADPPSWRTMATLLAELAPEALAAMRRPRRRRQPPA